MSDDSGGKIVGGLMLLGIVGVIAMFTGCTDGDAARRVLEGAGYTDIVIEGWAPARCGKDDWYATGFRAKGPNGHPITGTVCSGFLLKNQTIRFG